MSVLKLDIDLTVTEPREASDQRGPCILNKIIQERLNLSLCASVELNGNRQRKSYGGLQREVAVPAITGLFPRAAG